MSQNVVVIGGCLCYRYDWVRNLVLENEEAAACVCVNTHKLLEVNHKYPMTFQNSCDRAQ